MERNLIAQIRQAINDDAPRLVYADWLDEQGRQDEADFIRVQCALYHADHSAPFDQQRDEQARLLARNHHAWAQPFRQFGEPGKLKLYFGRGFVEQVDPLPLRLSLHRLFSAAPMLRRVHGCSHDERFLNQTLRQSSKVAQLDEIHIEDDDWLAALGNVQHCLVKRLTIHGSSKTFRDMRKSSWWHGVEELAVGFYTKPAANALAQLESPNLTSLALLDPSPEQLRTLARWPLLTQLRAFRVLGCTAAELEPLWSNTLPRLQNLSLHVSQGHIPLDQVASFAPNVQTLELTDWKGEIGVFSNLTTLVYRPISNSPFFQLLEDCPDSLAHLEIEHRSGGLQLAQLVRRLAVDLQTLSLSNTRLTDEGLEELTKTDWPHLRHLHLRENELTDQHLPALSAAAPNLRTLDLTVNQIQGDRLVEIGSQDEWKELRSLQLAHCEQLTDAAIVGLCNSHWSELLHDLSLTQATNLSAATEAISQAAFPQLTDCKLVVVGRSGQASDFAHAVKERFGYRAQIRNERGAEDVFAH